MTIVNADAKFVEVFYLVAAVNVVKSGGRVVANALLVNAYIAGLVENV